MRPVPRWRRWRQLIVDFQLENPIRAQLTLQQRAEQRCVIALVWLHRLFPREFEADASGRQIQRGDQPLALAFSQGVEQIDDGGNALGDMTADGMVQRLIAVLSRIAALSNWAMISPPARNSSRRPNSDCGNPRIKTPG